MQIIKIIFTWLVFVIAGYGIMIGICFFLSILLALILHPIDTITNSAEYVGLFLYKTCGMMLISIEVCFFIYKSKILPY